MTNLLHALCALERVSHGTANRAAAGHLTGKAPELLLGYNTRAL